MSRVLVIHPLDKSTEFLRKVYEGKGYDVISDFSHINRAALFKEIESHDKIIMLGHGTNHGLLNPGFPNYGWNYLIDAAFAEVLRRKITISIWCNSDGFFDYHGIPGFHTGMIISETAEQQMVLGKVYLNTEKQLENMEKFSTIVGECIEESPEVMKNYILTYYNDRDKVTEYNRKNITVL